jgi:mRNA-degrading endonuclease toxin of MazEF toxin-antitoxin module
VNAVADAGGVYTVVDHSTPMVSFCLVLSTSETNGRLSEAIVTPLFRTADGAEPIREAFTVETEAMSGYLRLARVVSLPLAEIGDQMGHIDTAKLGELQAFHRRRLGGIA